MALIVEDGTASSASANTYITVSYVDAFCLERGLSGWPAASTATTAKEQAIVRGMDYIESLPFRGAKTDRDNPCQFPRVGLYLHVTGYAVVINGYKINPTLVEDDEIPVELKKAQAQAAYEEYVSSGCLQKTISSDQFVIRKKIDVIETEYMPVRSGFVPVYKKITDFIKDLIESPTSATVLRT